MKHKLLDLFSGIGGFSLGAEANGIPTVAFVEKDPFCQKVLRKHWSNTPIISDIRTVKGEDYETDGVTIISGGFPCQPFSQAGKRKGTDDDRYLWDETLRVVAETKPEWFIGENVEGLINIQNGLVLRQVQDDLEREGFQVQCLVVPASGIGAWHQRKRVWIIAHSSSERSSSQQVGTDRQLGKESETKERTRNQSSLRSSSSCSDVPNTIGELSDGCSSTTRLSETELKGMVSDKERNWNKVRSETERCSEQATSRGNVSDTNHSRFKDWAEQCERQSTSSQERESSSSRHDPISDTTIEGLQGHRVQPQHLQTEEGQDNADRGSKEQYTWWQTESSIRGVPDGISYGLDKGRVGRIKALGNSIVPQIAYQLFKSIVKVS
tara:strand:- start:425 stop:1567 length:1143 start_codon:yes stop_codon:yes gene_type:complete